MKSAGCCTTLGTICCTLAIGAVAISAAAEAASAVAGSGLGTATALLAVTR